MEKIIGKHYAPNAVCYGHGSSIQTVSVGVCYVDKNAQGKPKLTKACVRVSGPNRPESMADIDRVAMEIARQLEAGTYNGPKTVRVQ